MGFGDGAQYSGGWLNDARHGHGSYRQGMAASLCLTLIFHVVRLPNGSCYDGDFKVRLLQCAMDVRWIDSGLLQPTIDSHQGGRLVVLSLYLPNLPPLCLGCLEPWKS